MKIVKLLTKIGLLGLAIIVFSLSIFWSNSSIATNAKYQNLINQGLINFVKTPQEMGLHYLSKEPVELAYDSELIDAIYDALSEISVLPEDIPLKFDLGTNSPIAIGDLEDEDAYNKYYEAEAIGYINHSGNPETFDAPILEAMFSVEARNGGNLAVNSEAQEILVADASGTFLQAKRIPQIDLIVHSQRTGEIVVLRDVNANAVCRDALNAVLNRDLKENNYF